MEGIESGRTFETPKLRTPEEYEVLLNGGGENPKVTLDEPESGFWEIFVIRNEQSDVIGRILLSRGKEPHTAFIVNIYRSPAHKDKHYGRAAYVELIKYLAGQHIRLVSGTSLSRAAFKIWEWLVEKGAARLVKDHGVDEAVENRNYTTSKYEVI